MPIGESKKIGLFSNFRGLEAGTVHGTVNTRKRWSDFETEPLIRKELGIDITSDTTLQAEVVKPVTRRLEDVARITKLLGKPGGISWEAHQAELQTIQNQLEVERAGGEANFKSLLKSIGESLVTDIGLTASTLAQVAVAGTGEHQTPFIRRAYLVNSGAKSGLLSEIMAAVGLSGAGGAYVNGGALTVHGKTVVGTPGRSLVSPRSSGPSRDGREDRGLGIPSGSATRNWNTTIDSGSQTRQNIVVTRTIRGSVDGRIYEDRIASDTVYGNSSVSTNQQGVRDRGQEHPRSDFSRLFNYESDAPSHYVPEPGEHSSDIQQLTRQEADGYLPGISGVRATASNYNPTGSVRQSSGRLASEFSDRNGTLNNGGDGFRMTKQFYSSSNKDTTYEGWIRKREGDGFLTVDERIRGTQDTQNTEINSRVGGQSLRLRDKDNNSLTYRTVSTADSAELQFYHEDEFYRKTGLIPFEISSITPETRYYMNFEANLETFDDMFTGNWNDVQYVGRADKFYNYTGFERQIDFTFKVLASRPEYLHTLYQRLNKLAATTAPTYVNGVFMRGTLVSVSIGDYLIDQKGIFKSVKLGWKTDYMWEIDFRRTRVPLVLDVSISFIPIQDFIPDSVGDDNGLRYFGNRLSRTAATEAEITVPVSNSDSDMTGQPGSTLVTMPVESTGGSYVYIYQGDGMYAIYDRETNEYRGSTKGAVLGRDMIGRDVATIYGTC